MSTKYKAPVDDYVFLLHDVIAPVAPHALGDLARDDTRQVLEQAARFFEEVWAPLDGPADEQGCRFEDGVVRTPAGYPAGYAALCEAGWNRVLAPEALGGAGHCRRQSDRRCASSPRRPAIRWVSMLA